MLNWEAVWRNLPSLLNVFGCCVWVFSLLWQALSEITDVEPWVCANLIRLFQEENTIPFIARYRKELINNLEADALREVQHALEELR